MDSEQPDMDLDQIWKDDVLERRKDAEFLRDFLDNNVEQRRSAGLPTAYVLNLNSPWGEGKTFFLGHLGQTLTHAGFVVASVNAWQDDYASDPLLSVMAGIEAVTQVDSHI